MERLWSSAEAEVSVIRRLAGTGKKIAFVSGNFNAVHPGHIRILQFAADTADFLVVGVNPDTASGVNVAMDARLQGIRSISIVNYAAALATPADEFIRLLKPDLVVKGKEYANKFNAEQTAVDSYGGQLLFSSGEMRFSLSNILQRDYSEANFAVIRKSHEYPLRHDFEIAGLKSILTQFKGKRVVVVGDIIVDVYAECDPLGMSQEDPTIVVAPVEEKRFVGGAGIVAAHAYGLGAEAHLVTVCGNDEAAAFVADRLPGYGVTVDLVQDETRPTTSKRRYRAQGKTLLRVNHLRQHSVSSDLVKVLLDRIVPRLENADLLLFADFNYGCLPQSLVDQIIVEARRHSVMLAADSQASSQLSDICRFRGMDLITPTEREARLSLQDTESGLVVIAEKLRQRAEAKNVVITLGSEGLVAHGEKSATYIADRLPAFNTAPKDVAGAGDSLFISTALALTTGTDIWRSVYLGSIAAACQVSRVGNLPLRAEEILVEIDDPDTDPEWTHADIQVA